MGSISKAILNERNNIHIMHSLLAISIKHSLQCAVIFLILPNTQPDRCILIFHLFHFLIWKICVCEFNCTHKRNERQNKSVYTMHKVNCASVRHMLLYVSSAHNLLTKSNRLADGLIVLKFRFGFLFLCGIVLVLNYYSELWISWNSKISQHWNVNVKLIWNAFIFMISI